MNEQWYSIEKNNGEYTIWFNQESYERDKWGGGGCLGIFTAETIKECIEYCKQHNIKVGKFD